MCAAAGAGRCSAKQGWKVQCQAELQDNLEGNLMMSSHELLSVTVWQMAVRAHACMWKDPVLQRHLRLHSDSEVEASFAVVTPKAHLVQLPLLLKPAFHSPLGQGAT